MRFLIKPLEKEHREQMMGWRYAAPYAVYNQTDDEPMGTRRGLFNETGALIGFFCWGGDARVPAANTLYAREPALADIGLGLAPEYTGKGLGLFALEAALAWLRDTLRPKAFRLAVFDWNERAIRVYRRAGFERRATYPPFWIMERDERPWLEASRPLENSMAVYPGDPPFVRSLYLRQEESGFNASCFSMSAHTGTHMDAPTHVGMVGGIECVLPENLSGMVQLLRWSADVISAIKSPRVLLQGCKGLRTEHVEMLLKKGVSLLGVDGLSVGLEGAEQEVHSLLLQNSVIILENLAIENIAPGFYEMRCLPLWLKGSDGTPIRALLREERQ